MSISSKSIFAFGPLFVGLLPVLAGCSMDASSGSSSPSESRGGEAVTVATQQSAVLTGTQTAPESGSRPSAWATPDIPRFTKLFRGQKVKIHLEAPDDELRGRDLRVFVSSLGFDGWSVRRQVATWTVDGPESEVELDLADLPLRPVGSASEARIEVEFLSPDAEDGERIVRIPSQAFSVAFSPDESEVYVGTQNDVVSVELASQLAIDNGTADVDEVASLVAAAGTPGSARKKVMRFVERGLGHLAGNVTADDGFVYPIEAAPREGILGSPESRGEHPANGPAVTLPGSWVTPKNIFPATAPPPGSPTKLAFFSWSTTSFRDSDFGEKALPGPNSTNALFPSRGRSPMSYVHVTGLNRTSSGAVDYQNGYDYALNSAGFLVEESRPAKMVLVFRHTDIGDATRHVFVDGTSFGEANGGLVDLQELDLRTTDPVHVTMVRETPASRAGAVVSTLLTTPSLSVPAVVRVHAGTGCSGTGLTAEDPATGAQVAAEACVSGGEVFLGRNIRQDETGKRFLAPGDTTEEKYVVAHELGHALDILTHGASAGGVAYTSTTWDGALCSCDHVRGANSLHCLQSKMNQAGGYLEGFAHFVATAVMNPNTKRDVPFVYYKEVLRPHWNPMVSGNVKVFPPVRVKAGEPVAWLKNRCTKGVEADRSTEYDWMTFLWGIHQRETAGSIDYATWMSIVRDGWCNGTNCTGGGTLSWRPVRANAFARFGYNQMNPRMRRMDDLGRDSAVDH